MKRVARARTRLEVLVARARAKVLHGLVHGYAAARYAAARYTGDGDLHLGPIAKATVTLPGAGPADVYLPPAGAGERPVVVYVHGGGFQMLSRRTHRALALPYARLGHAVLVVDYPLAPSAKAPAQLHAVAAALGALLDGAIPGLSPARGFVLAGESAGGNLVTAIALLLAAPPTGDPVLDGLRARVAGAPSGGGLRAVVATYGLLDLEDRDGALARPKVPPWARTMALRAGEAYALGTAPARDRREALRAAVAERPYLSPLPWLEDGAPVGPLPPFFIDCGTRDPLLAQSRRLAEALRARGARAELVIVPGAIHGYDALGPASEKAEKWSALAPFLSALT